MCIHHENPLCTRIESNVSKFLFSLFWHVLSNKSFVVETCLCFNVVHHTGNTQSRDDPAAFSEIRMFFGGIYWLRLSFICDMERSGWSEDNCPLKVKGHRSLKCTCILNNSQTDQQIVFIRGRLMYHDETMRPVEG